MPGFTFDTGALIGLERRHARISRIYTTAVTDGIRITTPSVVISEWWRSRTDTRELILRGLTVEAVDTELAKLAGLAIAAIRGATPVDALVMASAARRGDVVFTSDPSDLQALARYFPSVRVLST